MVCIAGEGVSARLARAAHQGEIGVAYRRVRRAGGVKRGCTRRRLWVRATGLPAGIGLHPPVRHGWMGSRGTAAEAVDQRAPFLIHASTSRSARRVHSPLLR